MGVSFLKFNLLTLPYSVSVESNSSSFFAQLQEVYPDSILSDSHPGFIDFQISFNRPRFRPFAPYAFKLGTQHFRYVEEDGMLPVFEWGLNWVTTSFIAQFLCFHAAVVEKNGITLVLPAPPGSGKSTLCAILMLSGWRLLSDEHCLLDLSNLQLVPYVRPVSIKNNSIDVIASLFPNAQASRIYKNTIKGAIRYLAPTQQSWQQSTQRTRATLVIFPKYQAQSGLKKTAIDEANLFNRLLENCFNYHVFGEEAFLAICDWLQGLHGIELTYSDNDAVLRWLETL